MSFLKTWLEKREGTIDDEYTIDGRLERKGDPLQLTVASHASDRFGHHQIPFYRMVQTDAGRVRAQVYYQGLQVGPHQMFPAHVARLLSCFHCFHSSHSQRGSTGDFRGDRGGRGGGGGSSIDEGLNRRDPPCRGNGER